MIDGWRRKDSGEPDRGMNKEELRNEGLTGAFMNGCMREDKRGVQIHK